MTAPKTTAFSASVSATEAPTDRIYLLMGMGKSGTTLLAKLLHGSGIAMVEEEPENLSYIQGNRYERATTRAINYALLDCEHIHSLKIDLHHPLRKTASLREEAAREVLRCTEKYSEWGFKDPRTSLTYDFWKENLPPHRIVVIYRHPAEVWMHYARGRRWWNRFRRIPTVVKHWCTYYTRILRYLEETEYDWLVINYEELLNGDREIERLSKFVGRPITDVRDPSKRNNELNLIRKLQFDWSARLGTQPPQSYEALLQQLNEKRAIGTA